MAQQSFFAEGDFSEILERTFCGFYSIVEILSERYHAGQKVLPYTYRDAAKGNLVSSVDWC
jgi:hypothetical protein